MPPSLHFRRVSRSVGPNYPDRAALRPVLGWAESLPARLAACDACEAKEGAVVRYVIDSLKRDYPEYPLHQPNAWAKGYRDVQLVLRHAANAMVRDDLPGLEENFLNWLRTILQAFVFHSPKFVSDTYVLLKAGCQRELPADAFRLMEPFLDRTIAVLSDVAEEYVEGPRPASSRPIVPTTADRDAAPARSRPAPEVVSA